MLTRRYSRGIIAILVLCGAAYWLWPQSAPVKPAAKVVETETIQLQDLQRTETFIGTICAKRVTALTAKIRGTLEIVAQAGQKVQKNDVIAHIMDEHSSQTFKLAEEKEKVAKTQYDRALTLHQQGAVSQNILEEKKNAWIEESKRKVTAQKECSYTLLQAPFDGVVGEYKMPEGSVVQEGTVIVSVFDPTVLEAHFDVPLKILPNLHEATVVHINNQTYPLTHVQRMVDSHTHMCPAHVCIQNAPFVIGQTVDVEVVVEDCRQVVVIPQAALFMQDDQTCVYRVVEGKAKLTHVTCGARQKDKVVIQDGLKPDDIIIKTAPTRIYPNSHVRQADKTGEPEKKPEK